MRLFYSPRGDRGGSETAHSLLAYAYMSMYGEALPEIKKTPNGKPYFPAAPHIHFSLSHSRTFALCAVACDPVGADTESPRLISRGSIEYFCSPEELSLFDPLELWVLKESYVKLTGATLPDVKRIRFSREGARILTPDVNAAARLYRIGGSDEERKGGAADIIAESYRDYRSGVSENFCIAAVTVIGEEPPDSMERVYLP